MKSTIILRLIEFSEWMLWTSVVGTFLSLLVLIWKRKSNPINMVLLTVFTLFEAYGIGVAGTCDFMFCNDQVSFYDREIVLQALILTTALFVGLTLFTMQSKRDFSGLAPFLFSALWVIHRITLNNVSCLSSLALCLCSSHHTPFNSFTHTLPS